MGILERKAGLHVRAAASPHAQSALMEVIGSSQTICPTQSDVHYKYIEGDRGIPQCHTQTLRDGLCASPDIIGLFITLVQHTEKSSDTFQGK